MRSWVSVLPSEPQSFSFYSQKASEAVILSERAARAKDLLFRRTACSTTLAAMKLLVPCLLVVVGTRALAAQAPQPSGSLTEYVYTVPAGWSGTVYPDGIVYGSPFYNTGERCQLSVFQMRTASGGGDLLADARRAFADIFKVDPFQYNAYPYPTATVSRGTAAAGWNYLVITKPINGRVGDGTLLGVRVFAAQLGPRVAIITSTGKAPLVSQCFGELVRDEWPAFFFSLSFKNWKAAPQ